MKRIKIVGLSLVALFALGAVTAGSAFASERPEYKKCGKTPKVEKKTPTGEFSNKECTEAASEGKYRLEGVPANTPFTSKSKGATFKIHGKIVKCKKDTDSGEILSQFVDTEKITFEDCYINGNKKEAACGNAASNTITTEQLGSQLFYINEAETENGVALYNEETGVFAEFKCGTETVVIEGILLGSIKNTSKGETITFAVNGGGEQAHRAAWFVGSEMGPLTLESGGEEATLETTDEQGPKGVGVFS